MTDMQPDDSLDFAPWSPGEREPNRFHAAIADVWDPGLLAEYLKAEREALMELLSAPPSPEQTDSAPGGLQTARDFSDLNDAVLERLFGIACLNARVKPSSANIAIVATGGYGRRELNPFSDVDLTFIPQRDGDPAVDRIIRQMFTLVMEVFKARCGLDVGYAYRLFEDCAALDHSTRCGLLDARLVAGSSRLFIQFEDCFWEGFHGVDFVFTKTEERLAALAKWGTYPYVVEPHLKEGPGGLRDLQTAVWLVQARMRLFAARARGERGLEVLVRDGGVPDSDLPRLAAAKEMLFRVRNALHASSGAERDELVITRQERIAELLGYGRLEGQEPGDLQAAGIASRDRHRIRLDSPPVERFMADLYASLGCLRRTADQVMRRSANSRLILGIGLDCERREILPNDALDRDDATWLLWAFDLAQRYGLMFSDAVENAATALARSNPPLDDLATPGKTFTQMLTRAGRVYPILQKMADLGILSWFLPEFGDILDLIPYDPSHDYTVGQHSLLVIQQVERLLETRETEEETEMAAVLQELAHPEQLFLAALLHDAGKAFPGRSHCEVGEDIAERVCRRLGWEPGATATVQFLVRNHLLMAETSRLLDLNLEETIRGFARQVSDLDRLNMLYLLTYADTRAVGAGVWTQVKGRFLRDLWRRASWRIADEEGEASDEMLVARARRKLLKDLTLEHLPEALVSEHVESMPAAYLLNEDSKKIALHVSYVQRVREDEIVIEYFDERDGTYTELTVCLPDDPKPGLLAKIAGCLYAASVGVHSADVITRVTPRDRIALDTLWIDFKGRQLAPGKRKELTANLIAVLSGRESLASVVARRRRMPGRGETQGLSAIEIRSVRTDLSETLTFIEAWCRDVPGMLYRMTDAISALGWDINSARVSTWQGQARATFYVAGARETKPEEVERMLAGQLDHGAAAGAI
jgi:[protein-PII] uridylyltransferase